jgi:glycosyltransferase involved in cell wall biosynthesis
VRKGREVFVKAAKLLPDTKFVVIGKFTDDSIEHLRLLASDNVHFTGFVSDEDLLKWYQRAKVYVQPSAHEGFGITVAESMLCECIPVVTDRFALPEVVGDTGFYSIYDNVEKTAEGINEALHASQRLAEKARERVIKSFSLERREERLVKSLCELYGSAK